jgi:hypothetical protein
MVSCGLLFPSQGWFCLSNITRYIQYNILSNTIMVRLRIFLEAMNPLPFLFFLGWGEEWRLEIEPRGSYMVGKCSTSEPDSHPTPPHPSPTVFDSYFTDIHCRHFQHHPATSTGECTKGTFVALSESMERVTENSLRKTVPKNICVHGQCRRQRAQSRKPSLKPSSG